MQHIIVLIKYFCRNFSDPCLAANSDNDSKDSGDKNSQQIKQNVNSTKNDTNSNLVATLLQQMNMLHETNSKIIRNLQDTKSKLNIWFFNFFVL